MEKRTKQTDSVINFQKNLRNIRTFLDIKIVELGKLVGLSRQNIWNLENGYVKMSIAQYVAMRHLFDYEISKMDDPDRRWKCKSVISTLVDNAVDPDYDWTEEIIRQVTEEGE